MLSTESWDNCEKPPLLFPFTALTCDELQFLVVQCLTSWQIFWINTALVDLSPTRK